VFGTGEGERHPDRVNLAGKERLRNVECRRLSSGQDDASARVHGLA
jgi:hypothetical protein